MQLFSLPQVLREPQDLNPEPGYTYSWEKEKIKHLSFLKDEITNNSKKKKKKKKLI